LLVAAWVLLCPMGGARTTGLGGRGEDGFLELPCHQACKMSG
jgi:hypothetical protein